MLSFIVGSSSQSALKLINLLGPNDHLFDAKTLIDIDGRVELFSGLKLAIGADNVTDKYPDPTPAALNTTGAAAFSNYSPFGRSGRFVYGRLSYDF